MKKNLITILTILSITVLLSMSGAGADGLNPGQFPYTINHAANMYYAGVPAGEMSGGDCMSCHMCFLDASYDNTIRAQFQAESGMGMDKAEMGTSYCVEIDPRDPSEVVNTGEYLSSSQKNYIGVTIYHGTCFMGETSVRPAQFGVRGNAAGLTTATANPMFGTMMVKLSDDSIMEMAGEGYSEAAFALSSTGFKLDKKGFWTSQCLAMPFELPNY